MAESSDDKVNPPPSAQDFLRTNPSARDLQSMMMLCNRALKDGDPRKFTADDVRVLAIHSTEFDELGPITDKVSAILPPE